jgi:hypothetical protein
VSFFDLPPASIDFQALDAFLTERLPESLNLDYKRQLSDGVFETIVAMANTYGGIVLVGVDEDPNDPTRPLVPPVGVDPAERERLVNQSYTRFQPPFAPDVVPVPLPDGKVVLVIRVDAARAERPVVLTRKDDNRILVRFEARNASADRYRMASLFSEPAVDVAAAISPGNWHPQTQGTYPIDDRVRPALIARIAVEARIPFERLDRAMIDTTDRNELSRVMEHSPLSLWLSNQVGKWANSWSSSTWRPLAASHSNRSWAATLRWRGSFDSGVEVPIGGQVALMLPAGQNVYSGRLTLLVDASYDPDPLRSVAVSDELDPLRTVAEQSRGQLTPRPRLDVEDLYYMLLALLDTAVEVVPPATFPRILGVPLWERIGPTAYLHTYPGPTNDTGLGHFLNVDRYRGHSQTNLELPGATFVVPRTLGMEDSAARSQVVKEWLSRLLLDMNLARFEGDLGAL